MSSSCTHRVGGRMKKIEISPNVMVKFELCFTWILWIQALKYFMFLYQLKKVYSDRELEESYVSTQAREPAVKDKRRSPPSDRPPTSPHANPHHSASPEDQESPERVVQKEKLHAELKQVLSLKRSHLKESSRLAQAEMDSSTEVQAVEETASEEVEVVVETEAEAGASGYSVTGGGERGLFIKDVLKDSTAAKHLSLQQGDQLLSARVYFDNVKYEDALKILQCAEPYKVSFFLKRTIAGADVTLHPGTTSLELKGPKTKMQKMSVKSIKPFKAKKKRGGRFGLKRLKENKKGSPGAELEMEGLPSKVELNPVDVEFAFPKFKLRKDGKAEGTEQHGGVVATGRKKRMIRCPRMNAKGAEVATGEVDMTQPEGQADVSLPDVPGAKVKVKGKGHRFGIHFPKTKKTTSDTALSEGSLELKPPDVKFAPPSVEFSSPSGNKEVNLQKPEVKGPFFKGPNISMPKTDISLPKIRSSDMDIEGPEKGGKISLPAVDISLPKMTSGEANVAVEGHIGKGGKFKTPTFDVSLPKFKSSEEDMNIEGPEVKGEFNMPKVDLLRPKGKAGGEVDNEGYLGKGGTFQMPTFDNSLPKMKSSDREMNVEGPEVKGGKIQMPDISLPEGKTEGEMNIEGHSGKGGKFKMPSCDVSLSKIMRSSGTEVDVEGPDVKGGKFHMPQVDISLPKGKSKFDIEGKSEKRGKIQMSSFDVSLPKIKSAEGDMKIEGSDVKGITFHMPTIDCSLPTGKTEVDIKGPEVKGGKFHMPKIDISLPKVKAEGDIKVEGDSDISLPKMKSPEADILLEGPDLKGGKFHGEIDTEEHSGKGGKFQMPAFDISLPKMKTPDGGIINMPTMNISLPKGKMEGEAKEHAIKGDKFHMPSVDISLPKMKLPEGRFHMPTFNVSLPKRKSLEEYVSLEGPSVKGGKLHMPTMDYSLPKGKGGKFQMTKFDVSLPKMKLPEGDIKLEGPEGKGRKTEGEIDIEGHSEKKGKFHMPSFDMSLPNMKSKDGDIKLEGPEVKGKVKAESDIEVVGHGGKGRKFHMPSLDISLPKMKLPEGEFEIPTIDISLPKGKAEGETDIEGHSGKGGKFHTPKFDVSLPKMKLPEGSKIHMPNIDISLPEGKTERDIEVEGHGEVKVEGPKAKGGKIEMPLTDILPPKGKMEGEIDIEGHSGKGGRFHMPTFNVSLPKIKSPEPDVSFERPDLKGEKFHMPKMDSSLPKGKGEIDTEGHSGIGGKFQMPALDISLPKMKTPEAEVSLEGPEVKGGKFEMPKIDISLPKGKTEREIDIEGHSEKKGKFHMPSFDMSLPKMKSKDGDIKLEGPEVKGSKIHMTNIDISLPEFHMPSLDISLPKMKLPEGEFEMPKIDIPLPKEKAEGETDIEGHSGKGGKFQMPKFDVSLPKMKLPEGDVKEGLEVKDGKFEMPKIEAEGRSGVKLPTVKLPTVDISAPKVDLDFGFFDMPDVSLKMPRFSLPKFGRKSKDNVDVSPPRVDGEGRPASPKMKMPTFGISKKDVSIASPDVEIKTEKGKVDIPTPGISVENPADKTNRKYRLKFPKFKKSSPKDFDRSGQSAELEAKGKVKMPSVEISLPAAKTSEQEMLIPDVSEADISGYEGNLKIPKMPTIDVSAPHIDLDVTLPKGGKFKMANIKMPDIDLSRGGKFKMPGIKMPKVDISLPKKPHMEMPNFDISLPKGKSGGIEAPKMEIEGGGGNFKMPHMKMPKVDFSLPKGNHGDISAPEMEGEGGKFKMPHMKMPNIAISLPKGRKISAPEMEMEGGGKFKIPYMKMPNVDISLPKGKTGEIKEPEMEIQAEGGKFKMPKVDISFPKGKFGEITAPEMEVEGGKFEMPHVKMPKVDMSLPKGRSVDVNAPELEIEDHKMKIKMPTIDIECPKGDLELDIGFHKVEGKKDRKIIELPDLDLKTSGTKVKGPKVKGTKFKIGMPKMKNTGDQALDAATKKTEKENEGNGFTLPHLGIKSPKIPDTDFDIGASQTGDHGADTSTRQKMKIPKFGVALPAISSPGARVHLKDPEVECEGPKMPKVKKAVFVLVNPQTDHSTMSTSVESGEAKIKLPKIKMKPSFGKSGSNENSAALSIEGDVDGDDKSKGAKLKVPKVTFSPGKTGSFDVTLKGEGSSSSLNGEKDPTFQNGSKEDKVKLGKLKLPKIEFSSPYSIIGSGEEDLEMSAKLVNESSGTDGETKGTKVKLGKMSFPGFKKTAKGEEETQDNVVSSSARTEMLDRDSSESQTPMVSIGFSSKKEMEEGEQSTWFKAPKFNLKPHSTGILHITPEGSPQGSRSSLQYQGLDETAGTFRLQMPSMRFSTHEVSEENVTTTKKGTVTVVTKTTKHTVTESRTGQTHTSLSHWIKWEGSGTHPRLGKLGCGIWEGPQSCTRSNRGQPGGGGHPASLWWKRGRDESKVAANGGFLDGGPEAEDDFGLFMQAEEQPPWDDRFTASPLVPSGKSECVALENHSITNESTHWTSCWPDRSFQPSEDAWTAFPKDSEGEGQDTRGQWWPTNAVEKTRGRFSAKGNVNNVFVEAFPSLSTPLYDRDAVPMLSQLLRGILDHESSAEDHGLLDGFHDLKKMFGLKYKRANAVSRERLLQSLHLGQYDTENMTGHRAANYSPSLGLPSSSQHTQACGKRRLSYDVNKNIME
ncbi:unnamed protein product [Oncorhynchus mykiss]|uniref:PDZ domain-containing protein n=1 Tax=Oncorhynchus mykiss TaxID=8022 RepID=A0A060WM70_ONCMY|nr:unnamed protein product [Oncorhynchus mykiss]